MVVPPTTVLVSLPQPQTHLLHVESVTAGMAAGAHEFFLPVWTPGSYLIREYARHVESVEAMDRAGEPLPIRKTAKNRWTVELDEPGDVRLRYRVYARDLTVRTNYADGARAYWNGAATYVLARERVDAPVDVRVEPPAGWSVHTGLPREDGAWRAQTLHDAVDAPFVVSSAPTTRFEACGAVHDCVWDGVGAGDRAALTDDLRAIVESAAKIFGGALPYEHYVFLVFADQNGSGGLEHANSCVIHMRRGSLRKLEDRRKVLGLFAHEHFHVWNVTRIRPPELAELDYERENYTRDLWVAEGFTSYYQEVIPMQAGLFTRQLFLDRLAGVWTDVRGVPGRFHQSVSDASFDAWIKLYRPDETTRNTTVSYYAKGAIVAFALDLLIQARSGGRKSLDDVMRGLWAHYEAHGPGQDRSLLETLVGEAAGEDLTAELASLVDGTLDPPLDDWLRPFGLRYAPPNGKERATLGVRTRARDGVLEITSVERGGAGYAMGLSPGDEPIAIDGERVRASDWDATLRDQYEPGQEVTIQAFRRGLLTSVHGRLGCKLSGTPRIVEEPGKLEFRRR